MTVFSILALGFFLGMRHATDSDHVIVEVYGPCGVAARPGLPATTFDSQIRSLGVNKHQFKVIGQFRVLLCNAEAVHAIRKRSMAN